MPQAGFNISNAPVIGQEIPASAKEFERMLSSGSSGGGRSTNALSQLMQLMRLRNMLDQQIRGRTKKERDAYDLQQKMGLAQNDVFQDAEYQQGYREVQNSSAQKALDKLGVMKKGVIARHAQARGVDPEALYKVMMGQLDAETRQYHKDVKEGKSFWGEVGAGLGEFWDAARYAWETDPEKRNQIVKEAAEAEAKRVQTNAYLRDQQLREAEGEGFFERSGGETGGFFANVGRGVGAMLPQIGIQLGARAGGAAIGGMAGSAAGPAGATIGGLAGAIFGGAVPGAAQAQYDFARRVMADPNLTDEQKQAALESGQWQATALGGALGAIPIGARDVARAVAPRIGQALGRGEAQELAKRAAVQEAERGWLGNIPRNTAWSAGELSAMMGGGVVGQNLIYGGATGQDIPAFEGMEEALAQGLVLAPVMGVASARPRYTRTQVAPWRAEGIAKYQENLRAQIANKDFGGEATSKLVKDFKATYSRPDDLTQLLTGLEPEQRAVIRKAYGATPERVVQSTETAPSDRQLAARGVAEDEAVGTEKKKGTSTRSGRISQMADAYAARESDPDSWVLMSEQSPNIAKHIEQVNARLDELSEGVKDFYDRLRREPTAVKKNEIAAWLANQPDSEAFIKAREDLRKVLDEAAKGTAGDTENRIYSYDKLRGNKYTLDELLPVLKAFSGKKYTNIITDHPDVNKNNSPIENARVLARKEYKWSGEIKEQGAEDGEAPARPVEQPAAEKPAKPVAEELGGNVPSRETTSAGTPVKPDSTMEAAAEAIAPEATVEPVQQPVGSSEPAKSRRVSRVKTSNVGEGEKVISTPEQAGVEPQQPGTNGGRSVEPAAPITPEADKVAGEPTSETGGSADIAGTKASVSEKPASASVVTIDGKDFPVTDIDSMASAVFVAMRTNKDLAERWYGKKIKSGADMDKAEKAMYAALWDGSEQAASSTGHFSGTKASQAIWNRMQADGVQPVRIDHYKNLYMEQSSKANPRTNYANNRFEWHHVGTRGEQLLESYGGVPVETPSKPLKRTGQAASVKLREVPPVSKQLTALDGFTDAAGLDRVAEIYANTLDKMSDVGTSANELLPGTHQFNDAMKALYKGLSGEGGGGSKLEREFSASMKEAFPELATEDFAKVIQRRVKAYRIQNPDVNNMDAFVNIATDYITGKRMDTDEKINRSVSPLDCTNTVL